MDIYICSLILSVAFIIIILMFVKIRAIDFKYSIFWMAAGIIMMVLSLDRGLTGSIAHFMRILYPAKFLVFMIFVFILLSMFYITIVISRMQKKITRLVQEIAVMRCIQDKGETKK